jgi:hypothetical protein
MREALAEAVEGVEPGSATADRLCHACVELLAVDGAAISLMHAGRTQGTFGSSSARSRQLDEYQFTFGEGPCVDSLRQAQPVLVPDLGAADERRWPAYAGATLAAGVRAVYALPVAINRSYVGALDLMREAPGLLSEKELSGGLLAARLAALPLLDLMGPAGGSGRTEDGWSQLDSLERVEVYQATGMIVAQLGVSAAQALVRLRGHALACGMTAGELSWKIITREVTLESDPTCGDPAAEPGKAG